MCLDLSVALLYDTNALEYVEQLTGSFCKNMQNNRSHKLFLLSFIINIATVFWGVRRKVHVT